MSPPNTDALGIVAEMRGRALGRRGWKSLALAACACLVLAGPAFCAGHQRAARGPYLIPAFELPGTNGFHVEVFGLAGTKRGHAKVGVYAWKDDVAASYLASGRVTGGRFEAALGRFGRIDVRFERQGERWVRSECSTRAVKILEGVYRGSVEFEGEEGFTQVLQPNLEAQPQYHSPWECSSGESFHGGGRGVVLNVYSRYAQTTVIENAPGKQVRYEARSDNRYGGTEVHRSVELLGPASGFRWASNLSRATVTPPPPFSGTATYRALGGRVTHWEGNLRVDFPGFARYPLTPGPSLTEFSHGSCHVYFPEPAEPHPPFGCL